MYHSITFTNDDGVAKNTWDDWHLIPSSRPWFTPAEILGNTVDTPGIDGVVDLTDLLTGEPQIGDSNGNWEFILFNGDNFDYGQWPERYSAMLNFLHGQHLTAVLEDDPTRYYAGRFKVSRFNSGASWSTITFEYEINEFLEEV